VGNIFRVFRYANIKREGGGMGFSYNILPKSLKMKNKMGY